MSIGKTGLGKLAVASAVALAGFFNPLSANDNTAQAQKARITNAAYSKVDTDGSLTKALRSTAGFENKDKVILMMSAHPLDVNDALTEANFLKSWIEQAIAKKYPDIEPNVIIYMEIGGENRGYSASAVVGGASITEAKGSQGLRNDLITIARAIVANAQKGNLAMEPQSNYN